MGTLRAVLASTGVPRTCTPKQPRATKGCSTAATTAANRNAATTASSANTAANTASANTATHTASPYKHT